MDIARIVMLGVTGALLGIQFKNGRPEYGLYIGVGVSLLIFLQITGYLTEIKNSLQFLGSSMGQGTSYLGILLKVTGITYLCELGSGICKDAGYQAVAAQIELFGKVMVLLTGMPVLLSLIDTIMGFMA